MWHTDKDFCLKDSRANQVCGNASGNYVSKLTTYFKVKLVKILEKYSKLKKSSLSPTFFKNYMKMIKEVFRESENKFK